MLQLRTATRARPHKDNEHIDARAQVQHPRSSASRTPSGDLPVVGGAAGVVSNNTERRRMYRLPPAADRRVSFAAGTRVGGGDRKGSRHEVDERFACCRRD